MPTNNSRDSAGREKPELDLEPWPAHCHPSYQNPALLTLDAHSRLTVGPWPQRASASGARSRCAGGVGAARPHREVREAGSIWVRLSTQPSARFGTWETTRSFLQENELQGAAEIGGLTCVNNAGSAPIMRYSPHLFSVHTSRPNTERTSDKYRCTSMFGHPMGSGRPSAPLMRWVDRWNDRPAPLMRGQQAQSKARRTCYAWTSQHLRSAPLMRGQLPPSTCPHLLCVDSFGTGLAPIMRALTCGNGDLRQ